MRQALVATSVYEGYHAMTEPDSHASSSLLLDGRVRAQVRRTDPYEVKGAYIWARRASSHPLLQGLDEKRLVALSPLAALVREEISQTLGQAMKHAGVNERHVRRLLAAERGDINEQLEKMVRLLGRKVNIADLVATSIYWGEKTARRVAIDYFGIEDEVAA